MKLKSWTIEHTKGLLIGILTICICIFIVILFFTFNNGHSYSYNFQRFRIYPPFTAKVISLAAIGNLPWFHFFSLRKEKWAFGQGIIIATILDLIVMLFIKYLL
jgi:hypothetical protein